MVKKQQKDLRKLTDLPNGNSIGQGKVENLVKPQIGRKDTNLTCSSDFRERIEIAKIIANKDQKEIMADCLQSDDRAITKELLGRKMGRRSLHPRLKNLATGNFLEVPDLYLPFESAHSDITTPSLVDDSQRYVTIREAFLINDAGNVVSHAARRGANTLDEHIVGSMLSAVQAFVKDAFGSKESAETGLETLVYGNTRILIEHGKLVFLVVVFSGIEPEGIREDLRKLVKKVENKYYDVLKEWDGDLVKVKDITQIIQGFITIKYRISRGVRDIDMKKDKDGRKEPRRYIQGTNEGYEGIIHPQRNIRQYGEYEDILHLYQTTSILGWPQVCTNAS